MLVKHLCQRKGWRGLSEVHNIYPYSKINDRTSVSVISGPSLEGGVDPGRGRGPGRQGGGGGVQGGR